MKKNNKSRNIKRINIINKTNEPNDFIGVKKSTKERFHSLKRKNQSIIDREETDNSFLQKLLDLYNKLFKSQEFKKINEKYQK